MHGAVALYVLLLIAGQVIDLNLPCTTYLRGPTLVHSYEPVYSMLLFAMIVILFWKELGSFARTPRQLFLFDYRSSLFYREIPSSRFVHVFMFVSDYERDQKQRLCNIDRIVGGAGGLSRWCVRPQLF